MAWYDSTPITSFKKEYTHNLGFKPIVVAYVDMRTVYPFNSIPYVLGWKQIPFDYSAYFPPDFYVGTVSFYHKDNNTIVFTAPENSNIVADIFIDPQEEAWYE